MGIPALSKEYTNPRDVESVSTLTGRYTPSQQEEQLKVPGRMPLLESMTGKRQLAASKIEAEKMTGLEPPRLLSNDQVTGNRGDEE